MGTGKEREVAALVATPGLRELVEVGTGPIRATYTTSLGVLYVVSGTKLYRINADFEEPDSEIGTINSPLGPVSFADNGVQMVLVDGDYGYFVTLADDTFAEITDDDFLGADHVTYIDGYFIFNEPDSENYYISALDGVTFDATEISQSDGLPDPLVGVMAVNSQLWLFGTRSIEIHYHSGNVDFPFEKISGAFIQHGLAAKYSIAEMDNTPYWLGQDKNGAGIVYRAQGYQPVRISTHAVETAIKSYGDVSNARSYTYQENGHNFYVLNFDDANTTWVFDANTGLWHERSYLNQGVFQRHRADCHAFAYSKHVVGDYESNKLYEMSTDVYSDDGNEIVRERTSPHSSAGGKRMFFSDFELDIETGVGIDGSGQGIDPKVRLSWSDDGGHTWSNEKTVSMGKIGEYGKRVIFRRLGSSFDRVWRVRVSDPVKVVLLGADVNVEAA